MGLARVLFTQCLDLPANMAICSAWARAPFFFSVSARICCTSLRTSSLPQHLSVKPLISPSSGGGGRKTHNEIQRLDLDETHLFISPEVLDQLKSQIDDLMDKISVPIVEGREAQK